MINRISVKAHNKRTKQSLWGQDEHVRKGSDCCDFQHNYPWSRLVHFGEKNKLNGVLSHICAHNYSLSSVMITFWGWSDEWVETALKSQDSKFELWRSEAKHATSRSREVSHSIESFYVSGEETFCFFKTWLPERGQTEFQIKNRLISMVYKKILQRKG